jgi:hypothetical protein
LQTHSTQGRRSSEANLAEGIRLALLEQAPIPEVGPSVSDVAQALGHDARSSLRDSAGALHGIDLESLPHGTVAQMPDRAALVRQVLPPMQKFRSNLRPAYVCMAVTAAVAIVIAGGLTLLVANGQGKDQAWPRAGNKTMIGGWVLLGVGAGVCVAISPFCCLAQGARRLAGTRAILEDMPMRLEAAQDPRAHAVLATLDDLFTMGRSPRQVGRALGKDSDSLKRLEYLFDTNVSRAAYELHALTTRTPALTRLLDLDNRFVVHGETQNDVQALFDGLWDDPLEPTTEEQHSLAAQLLRPIFDQGNGGYWYDRRMQSLGRGTLNVEPPAQARALARSVLLDIGISADHADQMLDQALSQTNDREVQDDASNTAASY